MNTLYHALQICILSALLTEVCRAGVIEVTHQGKPVLGARVFVTQAEPDGEETIVAQGVAESGSLKADVLPNIRYNVYVIAQGLKFFAIKDRRLQEVTKCSLSSLPMGVSMTALAERGVGFALLPNGGEDLIPVRANQGSPPDGWLLKIGDSGVVASKDGTKHATGEFWVKNGDRFKLTRDDQSITCTLLGSIARQFVIIECR
jgi:hypothetical protein